MTPVNIVHSTWRNIKDPPFSKLNLKAPEGKSHNIEIKFNDI